MEFYIRLLTEDDAEAAWELRLEGLQTMPQAFAESAEEHRLTTVEMFAEQLRASNSENFVLGAFDMTGLAGMCGFYREKRLKRKHRGWVWGVFVRPGCRGAGVGRALMLSLIERARNISGLQSILLGVATTQQAARRMYSRLGFRSIGIEPKALYVDGAYVDEEHMMLDLSEDSNRLLCL